MKRILVVATHPDDEVLGCGGVMARHHAEGDEIFLVVVTRGISELFSNAFIEQGRAELQAASDLLGVSDVFFLDFPAPKLDVVPLYQIAGALKTLIGEVRPQWVYFPHRGDIHRDHQAVFAAVMVAARPIDDCPVERLLCYETLSETEWAVPAGEHVFIPNIFVDISDYLATKLEAMACYESQLKLAPHPRSLEALAALAKVRGSTVSVAAAEGFMLMREIRFQE